MEFVSDAIILQARKHGETSAIVDCFTRSIGRHKGLVRGGVGRRMRPLLQPGNLVEVEWRGRLEEHLGYFTVEIADALAGVYMDDRLSLAALNALTSLLLEMLPEKQPFSDLYSVTEIVLRHLDDADVWPALYVRWETVLLQALGYGLDLSRCAATGQRENLTYVSPRSGRAVSEEAAQPYKDKLYKLPPFLRGQPVASAQDVGNGLKLTGHFLETRIQWERNRTLPDTRRMMIDRLVEQGLADMSA
jgi:DNA repair protein RecO (recombination protein O)